MNNEKLVETIRTLCRDNNITVTKLEESLGFSQGLISRWKDKVPSLDKIIDIADYFNVTLDEVVGRNNIINDDFIKVLYDKTVNKEIQWKTFNVTEDESGLKQYHNNFEYDFYSEEEYYDFCETHKEISYYFEYMSGFISIYAMYKYHEVTAPDEIKLFIQPDIRAELIPQQYDEDALLPLWLKVLNSLDSNAPDEIKAADLKQQILSSTEEQSLLNNFSEYTNNFESNDKEIKKLIPDEKTKQFLAHINSPEIRQLIKTFTDPKMVETMKRAKIFLEYYNRINEINNKRAGD